MERGGKKIRIIVVLNDNIYSNFGDSILNSEFAINEYTVPGITNETHRRASPPQANCYMANLPIKKTANWFIFFKLCRPEKTVC